MRKHYLWSRASEGVEGQGRERDVLSQLLSWFLVLVTLWARRDPQVIFSGLVYVVALTRWKTYRIVGFGETWARILHRKLRGEAYWMSHLPWSWPNIRPVKGLPREIRPNDTISHRVISAFTLLATSFMKGKVRRGQFERGLHLENVICQARGYFVMRHAATLSEPGLWVGCCSGSNDALLHVWMVVNCSWQWTVYQRWVDVGRTWRTFA